MIDTLFPEAVVTVRAPTHANVADLYPAEAACIERAIAKRRLQFTQGRLSARQALAQFGIEDFPLLNGPDRAPIWPRGIVGSISHCEGYCAVAVASCEDVSGVGFDVECLRPLKSGVVRRISTPAEIQALAELPGLDSRHRAAVVFSAKESVYKCYYPLTRTFLEYSDMEIQFHAKEGRFEARLTRAERPSAAGLRHFEGRFATSATHVFAGVTLPTRASENTGCPIP
jgi:4'-phosphopantetheinyl transferase EntD